MLQFRKQSLVRQILILTLVMLFILLISFIVSNRIAQQIVEKKVAESASKILLQVEETMVSFYTDMDGISYSLLYSPTIQSYLSANDILSRILMNNEIVSEFYSTLSLKENIKGIQIYDSAGNMIGNVGEAVEPSANKQVSAIEYSGVYTNQPRIGPYYTISVPVYNLKSTQLIRDYRGMCLFIMDVSNFNHILQKSKITEHSSFVLMDQNGEIIASSDRLSAEDIKQIENPRDDKSNIVQSLTLSHTGWKLISVIPKRELLQDLDVVKRLNIATYLIMFCLFCLFLAIFYNRILKPVKALMDFIKTYPKRGSQSRFDVVYHNEIGVLAGNLNQMLDDIDALSRDIQTAQQQMYETEIVKKQMEISAYRHQINPHFLYNTLECIRAIALYYKVEEIVDISTSLSNMYRYSVKGNNFVTVNDEINHLKEYAKIIGYRFRGKIQVHVDTNEELLDAQTLKMLLQPIVENAVFHGLEKKVDPGAVTVQVMKLGESEIQYVIRDNGCGMDEARLDELRASMQQYGVPGQASETNNQSIGLTNIYRRLKLFYGDRAEMAIDSNINEGTVVRITFPADETLAETEGT